MHWYAIRPWERVSLSLSFCSILMVLAFISCYRGWTMFHHFGKWFLMVDHILCHIQLISARDFAFSIHHWFSSHFMLLIWCPACICNISIEWFHLSKVILYISVKGTSWKDSLKRLCHFENKIDFGTGCNTVWTFNIVPVKSDFQIWNKQNAQWQNIR